MTAPGSSDRHSALPAAVLISALAHAAVLAALASGAGRFEPSASVLTIGLETEAPVQAARSRTLSGVSAAETTTPAAVSDVVESIPDSTSSADSPPTSAAVTPPATETPNTYDSVPTTIRGHLLAELARHFEYPHLARLRGWEGRVLLAFDIETDGRLENIRVAQSSGFAVLDDAALGALRRVERLAEAAAWLRGRELAMQIPVIYQLRCFGDEACREVRVATGGPENR